MNNQLCKFIMFKSFLTFCLVVLSVNTFAEAKVHYVINDHLGTPQVLVDQSQTVVWKAGSDAFGDSEPEIEDITFNLRFPGQYYDEETGTHYNYYRDYDPSTGRYLQSDPIGLEGGINTYGYVGGNPLSYIDPYGLHGQTPSPEGGTSVRILMDGISYGGQVIIDFYCSDGKFWNQYQQDFQGGPSMGKDGYSETADERVLNDMNIWIKDQLRWWDETGQHEKCECPK